MKIIKAHDLPFHSSECMTLHDILNRPGFWSFKNRFLPDRDKEKRMIRFWPSPGDKKNIICKDTQGIFYALWTFILSSWTKLSCSGYCFEDALPDRWMTSRWAAGLIWITKSVRRCVCFSSRIWLVRFGVSAVTSSERLLGLSFKLKNFKMKNEHLKWLKTIRMDRIGVNLPIFVR